MVYFFPIIIDNTKLVIYNSSFERIYGAALVTISSVIIDDTYLIVNSTGNNNMLNMIV
jgi:hypothetical protein